MHSERDKASENPYEPPKQTDRVRPHDPAVVATTLAYLLIVIALVGNMAALFLPLIASR